MGNIEDNIVSHLQIFFGDRIKGTIKARAQFHVRGAISCMRKEGINDVIVIQVDRTTATEDFLCESRFSRTGHSYNQDE
jgi:hypothetical protein